MTEELKRIALMISDQALYCVDSSVFTGLELCTETVEILRSRFLMTEEVASCINSLGSYQYFSEVTDSTQASKLITVLNGYFSLMRLRDLDLHYSCDFDVLGYEDASDDGEYEREDRSRQVAGYTRALQKYVHLCPSHPDFKVALGMLAAYFKLPTFIEWAEELQTDLPLNDSLSLFLDSQSVRNTTATELMHASRERLQDNSVMNRILVAKWLSLIPDRQTESLEDLFRSESLASSCPHLLAYKCLNMAFFMKNSSDALPSLRKTSEIMKHEPKFADKCARCYIKQAKLLIRNQSSQLSIVTMIYRAAKVGNDWNFLDLCLISIIGAYLSTHRFADLEHFVIFFNQVFPTNRIDSCLQKLGILYPQGVADLSAIEYNFF